ncbi:MAG: hypothetical protein OEW08_12475 [Gammaproteobacteria bacterium]|nr:hypothetical protein [Gammaproteobacteria bacterium]
MAIQYGNHSTSVLNVRYSAFLGMMYVADPETEVLIEQAKALVGEVEVKKGYTGSKGDSSTAKALKFLRDAGCNPIKNISGILTSAKMIERELQTSRKSLYLTIGLRDEDTKLWLSIDASQPGAKMLARKLATVEPGVATEISLFATYDQRPGAARAYGNHGASVKQHGKEVEGIDPKALLSPRIEAAISALVAAGIPKTDTETHSRRKSSVELAFHIELMQGVEKKFAEHYAAREQPMEHPSASDMPPHFADYEDAYDDLQTDKSVTSYLSGQRSELATLM